MRITKDKWVVDYMGDFGQVGKIAYYYETSRRAHRYDDIWAKWESMREDGNDWGEGIDGLLRVSREEVVAVFPTREVAMIFASVLIDQNRS